METIGNRIKLIRQDLNLSQSKFAKRIGLQTPVAISKYELNQTTPDIYKVISICNISGVTFNWLLTGNGPKQKGEEITNNKGNNKVEIPQFDCLASAGAGDGDQVFDDAQVMGYVPFDKNFIVKDMGLNPDKLSVITAMGDSMEPAIKHGDWLLVDMRQQTNKRDAIYIINFDESFYAKRLQFTPQGVYIRSDNSAYKEIFISKESQESFNIIGRIVWIGKKL